MTAIVPDQETILRAIEMLRVAAKYLKDAPPNRRTIFYDEANCDGWCLAEDCKIAADALESESAP